MTYNYIKMFGFKHPAQTCLKGAKLVFAHVRTTKLFAFDFIRVFFFWENNLTRPYNKLGKKIKLKI